MKRGEEKKERGERREERKGVSAFRVPVWLSGWVLVGRCGRGVRCGLPVCLAPAVFPVPAVSGLALVFRFGFSVIEDMTITLVFTCCIICDRSILLNLPN